MFTTSRRTLCLVVSGLLALLGSCSTEESVALLIELRTDFAPGQEFDRVVSDFAGFSIERVTNGSQDFIEGVRVADFNAAVGVHTITVELRNGSDSVARRAVRVEVRANTALRVVIARSCLGLSCPGSGDDASLTECFEGRCVDPRCSSENRELCGDGLCVANVDCDPSVVACAATECGDGACLSVEVAGACLAGEWCNPEVGCEPRVPIVTPDAGVDAGSDAPIDTGPSCDPDMCDDGVGCTDDVCQTGVCAAVANDDRCDLEPGGTCDAALGCQYPTCTTTNCMPADACETASCESDMCRRSPRGSCRGGQMESETRACGDCGTQTRTRSCGADCEFGTWSAWSGCMGEGVCSPGTSRSEDRTCGNCGTQSRDSDCNSSCGYDPFGPYGTCMGEGVCASGATQMRTIACGNCGTQSQRRTCSSGCAWGGWTDVGGCTGEGVCMPGASDSQTAPCPCGGTRMRTRTCEPGCEWGDYGPFGGCMGGSSCESCGGPAVCDGEEGYRDEGICFRLCSCEDGVWTNCATNCESTCRRI